jgi:hypothetical protein
MPFKLSEVKSAVEFAEVVQVQADAFDSPLSTSSQLFYPVFGTGPTARQDAIKGLIARQWYRHSVNSNSHWLKVVDTGAGNKAVAGAAWVVVDSYTEHSTVTEPFWIPEGE